MKYRLDELIDIEQFQALQDRLNEIYCFPSAIIDNEGRILTATAWQDVCTKFHRQNPLCEAECVKSDQYILDHLHEANPAISYQCPHGLIDNAAPIIIEGEHLGNFFTGQFFLEEPDLDFFRRQAREYGFEEEAYLEAVKKVPIWSQKQLDNYLFFIKGLIEVISNIGLKNLREVEARKEIEKSEGRFRALLRTTTDGFWLADLEGRLLLVNEAYSRMSGYSSEELRTMRISDLEAVENLSKVAPHQMRELLRTGQDRFETRHRTKDGHLFDVEVSVQILPGEGETSVAFIRDITERKRAEQARRESEERYRLLVEHSPDAIYILVDDVFVFANTAGLSLLGASSPEELIGTPLLDRVEAIQREEFRKRMSALVGKGQTPDIVEDRLLRLSGEAIDVELVANPTSHTGQAAVQLTVRDIGERKKAEAEREQMREQLVHAQKMESVGRLAGGVAHDFNNMLGVILGHLEMAMETTDPSHPLWASLKEMSSAATRSADLTRQLLAFARRQAISPKVVDLNEAVSGMLKILERLIGEDIELTWDPGPELWPVTIDPGQIDQIMANLCVNARDAINGVGKIIIETQNLVIDHNDGGEQSQQPPGDYVVVSVSDDGCGMTRETLDKLFEPFFTTKGLGEGTGLGLATVFGAIKQNKGFIEVHSEPGVGTTFRLFLPRHVGTMDRESLQHEQRPPRGGTETILLVEDEHSLLKLEETILGRLGYRVMAAASPIEAVRMVEADGSDIDLLVTDVVMPGMNGKELGDRLEVSHPKLKRLYVSGYTADIISHHGVLDSGVRLIQKPFDLEDFATTIRDVLEGT